MATSASEYTWLEEPLLRTPAQPRQQAAYGSGRGKQQAGDSPDPEAAVVPSPAAGWRLATEVFEEPPVQYKQSSLWDTTVNLTNAILGAGMLAFPRAFAGLGLLGGGAMTVAVAIMTYASIAVMLRPTERTRKLTYAAVMEHEWGHWAGVAVRFSIVVGSAGFLVLYLIVLADLLVGSEEYSGIIPDLWPQLPDPLPWYLGRTAMLTWATLLVAPALCPKTLGGVAPISIFKIGCSFLCVAACVALAIILAVQGQLPAIHLLPDPSFFGDSFWERLKNVVAVVPVIMTAFVCQMSIHPLVSDLHDYTPRRMRTAVGWSMVLSGTTYATIGVSGFMVFGVAVQGDVLSNLNIDDVAKIMGGNVGAAMAFVATVKVAMAISMVLSFPITIWPMREDIIEMLAHSLGSSTQLSPTAYYLLTYTSLLAIYLVAVGIQSAYSVVGIVGATCGTTMGFIFPGMLALRDPQGGAAYKAFGWGLLAAGAVLFAVGVTAS
ncbi:hypothetical protein COHA_000677 [Chlorella ohadii]|uniref:Amino acid transporter transmembrane domain-containing protein n=1 Tax=Chlorella ohadii TaxID=2649997 RepID=A0AAD5H8V1_9CHLO|nr:hypothetical protein COHA_000677 [Chlorella ohadii]